MSRREVILTVLDPGNEEQSALARAIHLAKRLGMHLDLFICDYDASLVADKFLDKEGLKSAKRQVTENHLDFLEGLAGRVADEGIPYTAQAAWDRPLHEAIIRQVLRTDPRYVLKDTHFHSAISRALFTNTDWHLINNCPAPLWLVKPGNDFQKPSIMAAVDPLHKHDKPAALDARILSEACELGDSLDGVTQAFHAFNPYLESDYPQRIESLHDEALRQLTDRFQLGDDRVHLIAGVTSDIFPQVMSDQNVDLVVMGSLARSRLENAIIGSTAEKVMDQLSCDLLIIKPKGFCSPIIFKKRPRGYFYAER